MRMFLDTQREGLSFTVAAAPREKTDQKGQPVVRDTGEFVYVTNLLVRDSNAPRDNQKAELIAVSTTGNSPNVTEDQKVAPVELEALYWNTERGGKSYSGISFRAKDIMPAVAGVKSAPEKTTKAA